MGAIIYLHLLPCKTVSTLEGAVCTAVKALTLTLTLTPNPSEGQGSMACCSPRGHKESDMTERLNNNDDNTLYLLAGWCDCGQVPGPLCASFSSSVKES